jgi:hypothetical protein
MKIKQIQPYNESLLDDNLQFNNKNLLYLVFAMKGAPLMSKRVKHIT